MGSKLDKLIQKQVLQRGQFPSWIQKAVQYEVLTGSFAYSCSDGLSDYDILGFCMPSKEMLFPHLAGKLHGFDEIETFGQWQKHHVIDKDANAGKGQEYDFTIYNIVKYVKLCHDNNPNMIDTLFVARDCILHSTPVAEMIRARKELFLSKKCFHKFTGYLHSQISKLDREPVGKRKALVDLHGFDTKYAMHGVRLSCQIEQILTDGTLDLRRDAEMYKAIRRGEWTLKQVKDWVGSKELHLQQLYEKSKLRHKPATKEIKQLLLDCIETHYGTISEAEIVNPDKYKSLVDQIRELVQ